MTVQRRTSWIAVAGDLHGAFEALHRLLERFERAVGAAVDLVLQVGDVGAGPALPPLPCELVLIEGNHDASVTEGERVTSLAGGRVVERLGLRIGGLPGEWHPRRSREPGPPRGGASGRDDVARLLASGGVDVLLLHEWPRGLLLEGDRARLPVPPRDPEAFGSPHGRLLVERLLPSWVFCGHHHVPYRRDWELASGRVSRVRCLADVARGGADAVTFLRVDGGAVAEAAPLEELEAFAGAAVPRRGRRKGGRA